MNEIVLNEQNQLAQQIIDEIVEVEQTIKDAKERQDELKAQLTQVMGEHMIKSIDNDSFKIIYFPESEKASLDSTKLKNEFEEIYLQCLKKSTTKAFVKITLK